MNLSLPTVRSRSAWILGLFVAVLLWFILINQLRLQWAANAQYSYGWVMPLLCLGLLSRRWFEKGPSQESRGFQAKPSGEVSTYRATTATLDRFLPWCFAFCALLLFPLRLVLEANPDWRTLNWLLACDVVGLTLLAIYYTRIPGLTRRLAFPIAFILMAVPWPFSVEVPLIQGLTRATVAATVECLGWVGIPASQHGNVIEIGTGLVGVADACSGIRSFQSSLMISLFLGEFFRFSLGRRFGLVLAGVSLAFLFNICRTSFMVTVASKQGVAAIERWHDPAGLSISFACVLGLWGLSLLFKRWQSKTRGPQPVEERSIPSASGSLDASSNCYPPRPWFGRFALALLVWLILVEVTVEAWYRAHESRAGPGQDWTLNWPTQEPGFHEIPVSEAAREMLSYNEGHSGAWTSEHGIEWLMYYFRWASGRTAAFAARTHTPGVCLAAAGKALRPIPDNQCPMVVHSLEFPFRRYEFEENGQLVYVFHCLWEDNAPGAYSTDATAGQLRLRLEAVLQGRRNLGQRSLELAITGVPDLETARNAVQQQLQKLISLVRAP
jgi:exosortase